MPTDLQKSPPDPGVHSTCHAIPGSQRSLRIVTVTGAQPGPTLAVIGAIHGDELEGPLAIGQLLSNLDPSEISGRLILLPVANPEAVAAGLRCAPIDGKNLARVFPGNPDGTPTEAAADLITRLVIAPADALIDLHSAGVNVESPLFAGYPDTPGGLGARAAAMARAFGAPVVFRHGTPTAPGRTISIAEARGIPAIYLEATGGVSPCEDSVDAYAEGVLRVMQHLGMIPQMLPAVQAPLCLVGAGNLDAPSLSAPVAGLLVCHARLCRPVSRGEICFTIRDVDGTVLAELAAQSPGYPVFLRRTRWAEAGEMLMLLAVEDTSPS